MSEVRIPRGGPGDVLDELVRRVGDLERRMRVRGDGRLKLAPDSVGSTLQSFLDANYATTCTPVPGGSLQCATTIGQLLTGDTLVSVNVVRTSTNFDAYFTHNDFTWTAVVDCTVFASFSATVSSGGTENTLGLFSTSAGGSYASGPDGASLVGNDLIEVAAGDDIWLELTHDGGGHASVYDARLTLLLVCAAASEGPPN